MPVSKNRKKHKTKTKKRKNRAIQTTRKMVKLRQQKIEELKKIIEENKIKKALEDEQTNEDRYEEE